MIRQAGVVALALLLVPQAARADLRTYVDKCGGAKSTPHEMVNFCQKAIDTGQLGPTALAQVYANLSIGWFELGQYQSALQAADKAVAAKPDLVPALLNRARAYEKLRRLGEAARDYEAALRVDRNSAEAYLGRGIMLLRHGDPGRAVQDLSAAVQLQPSSGAARFNRGLAYLDVGQPDKARQDFDHLVRQNPKDAEAVLYRGEARAALSDRGAAEDFDKAVEMARDWPVAWFVRGRYRDSIGDREGANGDFLRAYELGHSDPWLIERVREISR